MEARTIARKSRRKAVKKEAVRLSLSDYQFPGEMGAYWTAVGSAVGIFMLMALMLFAANWTGMLNGTGIRGIQGVQWWPICNFIAYPIVSILISNILATRHTKQLIAKSGRHAKVMPNNYGDLHRWLTHLSKLACISVPDMYLLEDDATYMYSIPGGTGTIVASTAMRDSFTTEEFTALLAIEIGHVKSHHMSLMLSNLYIRNASIVFKILLLPATAIQFLSQGWADLADYSADRVAMLLLADPTILNVTMVKKAVIMDSQADISAEELQAFMVASGDMSTDSAQMERHFKIGKFMSEHQNLAERVEQLRDFLGSAEGIAAFEKMDAVRREAGMLLDTKQ